MRRYNDPYSPYNQKQERKREAERIMREARQRKERERELLEQEVTEEHKIEGAGAHFDRYIAGDR